MICCRAEKLNPEPSAVLEQAHKKKLYWPPACIDKNKWPVKLVVQQKR